MKETNGKATVQQVYELVDRKIDGLEQKIDKVLSAHDDRINKLENGQAKMFGGLAVVAAIWTYIWEQIIK